MEVSIPIIVVTKTNWMVRVRLGMITCRMIWRSDAPSTRAASSSEASRVLKPARNTTRAIPNVAQMCTPTTVNMAMPGSPSQSTGPAPITARAEFNGPSYPSRRLKIAPTITGESTAGKK
jgi:hypothetical protein